MKILVCHDGSMRAAEILPPVARIFVAEAQVEIHLLRVLDPAAARPVTAAAVPADGLAGTLELPPLPRLVEDHGAALARLRTEAQESLDRLGHAAFGATPVTGHVEWSGEPAAAIVRTAERLGVDLIAMRTRSRAGLGHFLSGSVTEDVIRHSPVPVFVAGPNHVRD
jgi:nucleotide-binding universal stress UspA family protein